MSDQDPDEEGRKKREKWKHAAQLARDSARYTATVVKLTKTLIDLIGFIDRHL